MIRRAKDRIKKSDLTIIEQGKIHWPGISTEEREWRRNRESDSMYKRNAMGFRQK